MNLPPANPALIRYPYVTSTEFPELGTGGRTAMAGPVYHFDPELDSTIKLPEYFDDTLIMYEWSRSTFFEVKLDQAGQLLKINRIFAGLVFNRPMDVELGPDGALYVIEWGAAFGGGPDAKLVRVEFLGNRPDVTGDYNGNDTVDAADYVLWRKTVGSTTNLSADGNGNRVIDGRDYAVWQKNFGESLPSPEAAGNVAAAGLNHPSPFATGLSTPAPLGGGLGRGLSQLRSEPNDVGRNSGDDLLLLATNRVLPTSRLGFSEPFGDLSDEVVGDDIHNQILIDELLAMAFETWK
jgi:hypothetical protein